MYMYQQLYKIRLFLTKKTRFSNDDNRAWGCTKASKKENSWEEEEEEEEEKED